MSTQEAKIPRLVSLLGGVDQGEMHVGGIPVGKLAEQVGEYPHCFRPGVPWGR